LLCRLLEVSDMNVFAAALLVMLSTGAFAQEKAQTPGEILYRKGVLPGGQAVRGEREAGIFVEGIAAACVTCHRRSGLGTSEGQIIIPPITETYLYRPRGKQIEDMDLRYVQGHGFNREAHTDASLAKAIREGLGVNGRKLNYLMPRYDLDDATMASLIAYLKGLSKGPYRGASDDTLHFATIITPDADPVERKAMLDVMERFFADKNEFIRGGSRPLRSTTSGVGFRVTRKWQLHVWQLSGPADSWEQQLKQRLVAEPVMAVISGLSGKTWAPVHHFCEQFAVPCLLPNVELPVVAERDFYPLYFSKGVLLEAELVAQHLRGQSTAFPVKRLIQVYRAGDIGDAASQALADAASGSGMTILNRPMGGNSMDKEWKDMSKDLGNGDVLMLWLRAADLAALPPAAPKAVPVYFSGLMGHFEDAPIPPGWRESARIAYPADLPELRKFRMNFPLNWLKVRHIPIVAERVQADTYVACGIVAEMLNEMLDSFVPEYLEERIESMLSYRTLTGYYPRLGLAQGQRFASKGGYIAKFVDPQGSKVVADGEWIVP
jgi:hypothetical protein